MSIASTPIYVPYFTSTERGSLRASLQNADVLALPPDCIRLNQRSICSPQGLPATRREFLKRNAAAAAALGVAGSATTEARASGVALVLGIGAVVAVRAITYFLTKVGYYVADRVFEKAQGYIDAGIDAAEETARAWLRETFIPSTSNLYKNSPNSGYHYETSDKMWYPDDLTAKVTYLKDFGMNLGLKRVQWDISDNCLEHSTMQGREGQLDSDDPKRSQLFAMASSFRRRGFADALKPKLSAVNELYLGKDDEKILPGEVAYWIPLTGKGRREYTGFCTHRGGKDLFFYV
ncbi:MAG TPA: hypothetical protein VF278_11815 [Pirellulales bacterium]